MKPNNRPPETFANRCAQFLQSEKLNANKATPSAKSTTPTHPDVIAKENPYMLARLKVLANYKEDRRIEVLAMERDNNLDNRFYAAFIADIVTAAGDVPSLQLRNYLKGI